MLSILLFVSTTLRELIEYLTAVNEFNHLVNDAFELVMKHLNRPHHIFVAQFAENFKLLFVCYQSLLVIIAHNLDSVDCLLIRVFLKLRR